MEENVFPSRAVAQELQNNFIEARLHNDGDVNIEQIHELQEKFVGKPGAPYYVVVDPTTEGKLRVQETVTTPETFADFLRGIDEE